MENQLSNLIIKVLILGDTSVGKTNIFLRYCDNQFLPNHITTLGIDFKVKKFLYNNEEIKLQIWDTAGQQRFWSLSKPFYNQTHGIILTYAINDRLTFQSINKWNQQIQQNTSSQVIRILVGNKCDLQDQRQVSLEQGKQIALQHGIQFFEVSAKEDIRITQTFQSMVKQIIEKKIIKSKQNSKDLKNMKTKQKNQSISCCN